MSKYMSLFFLYEKSGKKKTLIAFFIIPICFLAVFLARVGDPSKAASLMLMERGFGGMWDVIAFVLANLLAYYFVVNALNGKKALKAAHSTTGYTIRRMSISPIESYLTMLVYSLAIVLILWATAIVSICVIGKAALSLSGAAGINTKIALGLMRTRIGAALIPFANPIVLVFDVIAIIALAGECARSCYLGWHNGSPSVGVVLIAVLMFIAWSFELSAGYLLLVVIIAGSYAAFSILDVIFREKRPKGDPFRVNKYSGIIDMDSVDFEEDVFMQVNSGADAYEAWSPETSILNKYGRIDSNEKKKGMHKIGIWSRRQRFMPIGSNMEKANFLFGLCVCIGLGEHILFLTRYIMHMREITVNIKGVTIDPDFMMPYFWELQNHTLYGYFAAILLVLFVQAYWNYAYYNKETKSMYVMKRLPDRKEYSRTIWTAPKIEAFIILIIMLANIFLDFGIYAFATPDVALKADYLSHLLPF